MKTIFKKVFYRILIFFEKKLISAKIYYNEKNITLNSNSRLYKETIINNLQLDVNKIKVGINTHIRGELQIFAYGGEISIGDNSFVGVGSRIWSGEKINIGSNVLISHNVNIIDTSSHEMDYLERAEGFKRLIVHGHPIEKGSIETASITIGDHVWISFNSVILKGVTIGEGAIIGANTVVTTNVPAYSLVAGNPAKVIRKL